MSKVSTILFSGTAVTAESANSTGIAIENPSAGVLFQLDVTAAGSAVDDTLDVKVQTTLDGTNWMDVAYFTQVLGNGGVKRFAAKISATEPQALFPTTTALTAGNIRHVIGSMFRVTYTVAAGAGTHTFTFSVIATPS